MWPPLASRQTNGGSQRLRLEEVGGDVALEVVDRDQGQPPRGGDRLRGAETDEQGADQARPGGHRHRFDAVEIDPGLAQGGEHDRLDQLQVLAGRHLGNDPAVVIVRSGLRGDHVGEDPRPVEHGGAGVVTGGLDREDQGGPGFEPHDQGVLAVVVVVAPAHARGAKAEPLVHRDRLAIGDPYLQRQRQFAPASSKSRWISCVATPARRRCGSTATFIRCQTWS